MTHQNGPWKAFLGVILLIAAGYSCVAFWEWYQDFRLNQAAPVAALQWKVLPINRGKYYLEGSYTFENQGRIYNGTTRLTQYPFWNIWAAEQAQPELTERYRTLWFQTDAPQHSSLIKEFPWKRIATALVLWGLALYFLWLGFHVKQFTA